MKKNLSKKILAFSFPCHLRKNQDYAGNLKQAEILYIILPYGIVNVILHKGHRIFTCYNVESMGMLDISETYHPRDKENLTFDNSPKDSNSSSFM